MTYESTVLADTPSSYWTLGETVGTTGAGSVVDSGSSGFNGTPSNVTFGSTGLLAGSTATSATFTIASSSAINMGNQYNFSNTTSFSIEAWINPTLAIAASNQTVVGKWHTGAVSTDGWTLYIDNAGHLRFERWAAGVQQGVTHTTVLSNTTTYYVAATYDGVTCRISLDAAAQQTNASGQNIDAANTAKMGIGAFDGGTFYYMGGKVAHVAVYSGVVLTTGQISAHHTAGITAPIQQSLPGADISVGTWTTSVGGTTNLFQQIDEATFNDADFIQSVAAPASAVYTGRLSTLTDPAIGTGHVVNYRGLIDTIAGGSMSVTTDLLDASGSALSTPATWTDTFTSSVQPFTHTLTTGQADAIPGADYATGLQFKFTALQNATTTPSWIASGTIAATASNAATFTPVPPNGAIGDLLLLVIERQDGTVAPTVSSWTNVAAATTVSGTAHSVATYTKIATSATGSTDQTAVTFGSSTVLRSGRVFRFRNTSASAPIHLSTILATASTATTVNATNLTSTINNTLGVFIASMIGVRSTTNTTTNWTAGAGVTAFASTNDTTGNDSTFGIGIKTFDVAGSYLTPGIVWTTNTTTGPGMGVLLSLAPVTNNSRAQVTWFDLEVPLAPAGGSAHHFRTLLGIGI